MILKGVRVLDLSQIIAGPFGSLILADLGAEVIKIENPEGGDLSRATVHYTHKGEGAYYLSFNRTKKSMTLTGAPRLGEHTEEILSGYLRYTPDRIHQLRDRRSI